MKHFYYEISIDGSAVMNVPKFQRAFDLAKEFTTNGKPVVIKLVNVHTGEVSKKVRPCTLKAGYV